MQGIEPDLAAAPRCSARGWPSNGGGRLVGSLAGLPYALAEAEQNFLIPTQTQALIWGDLVPQMILSAKIPRWWQRDAGADALGGAAHALRRRRCWPNRRSTRSCGAQVLEALAAQAPPARTRRGGPADRGRRREGRGGSRDAVGAVRAGAAKWRRDPTAERGRALAEIQRLAAEAPERGQLRSHLARLRHAQADAGQFLPAGTAEPAHVPHADGLFEPHHGGELGIEHALLGGAGRRDCTCRPRS